MLAETFQLQFYVFAIIPYHGVKRHLFFRNSFKIFVSITSIIAVFYLGFHQAAWISSRLRPAPKNASEKRLEVCVPRAVCLLPQWWENATGLCLVRFGHWHGFHGYAADCLGLDRPGGETQNSEANGCRMFFATDSWFCIFWGSLRLELNLDIGILGGGFKYFLCSPLF